MRISDLIRLTGAPKQTIHYYIREGLLPKPVKLTRNSAEYGEEHVERILLVRELQEKYFLPLSAIKKILKKRRGSIEDETLLRVQSEYFRPLDHLLSEELIGEALFLKKTGLTPERLAEAESWGVISPLEKSGRKVYSSDDLNIGKAIEALRRLDFRVQDRYPDNGLMACHGRFQAMASEIVESFWAHEWRGTDDEAFRKKWIKGRETLATLCYYMFRKLTGEAFLEKLAETETPDRGGPTDH